jgi:periplasmic protein TorT
VIRRRRSCWLLRLLTAAACVAPLAAAALPPEFIVDGQSKAWSFLSKASKPWRLCVLLPHGKDRYWWGVSWGADQQAKQLGVDIGIYQAGGYEYLETQRQQWADCKRLKADAYILGAIQADALRAEIDEALAAGRPVIDLVNGVDGRVSSRSLVSFADMAEAATRYALAQKPPGAVQPLRLAWFPGPAGAGWVQDGNRGLRQALAGKAVQLLDGGHGATDAKTQASLVRDALDKHGRIDILIGNAVAVEFASRLFARRSGERPLLVAYYATEEIIAHIRDGSVAAAPTDQPVLQARMAVDLAVRALQGEPLPKLVSPRIEMLSAERLRHFDLRRVLPPPGQWMVQKALPP